MSNCPENKMPKQYGEPVVQNMKTGKALPIVNNQVVVDVADGPVILGIKENAMNVLIKGIKIAEHKVTLASGVYVINEINKQLFVKNSHGRYEVYEKRPMIVCDLTSK